MAKTSTDVAPVDVPQLPALVTPSATGNLDSGDISLPRLYKGEYQAALVQDDVVPKGSIYVATGGDDPDPQVIVEEVGAPIRVHILKAWKGKSANILDGQVVKSGGEFRTWQFEDPQAPAGANVDFHYVLMLPDVDPDVPVKFTMSKTSVPAGRKINFVLLKNPEQPPYSFAFELNTKKREGGSAGEKYKWFVWEARVVEAKPEDVAAAGKLAELVQDVSRNDIETTSGSQPAI